MKPKQPTSEKLTSKQAAEMLGISVRTLANWRIRGVNLPYTQYGQRGSVCLYDRKVLEQFIAAKTTHPVGEAA